MPHQHFQRFDFIFKSAYSLPFYLSLSTKKLDKIDFMDP